jgi:hypothetical protein
LALVATLRVRPAWIAGTLALLLAVELLAYDRRLITDHETKEMVWPESFVDTVLRHPYHPFRLATVDASRIDAVSKCRLAGIDHVGGYDPMMLRRYLDLTRAAAGIPSGAYAATMTPGRPGAIYDMLGARYWIVPGPRQTPPGWGNVGQIGDSFIYENPRAMPRAFLVGRSVVRASEPDRLKFMTSPSFEPARMVVLESGAEGGADLTPSTVTIRLRGPGFYELKAEAASDGWLVLTEADYPGWTATVDGAPAPILRANHFVQAVKLTPGVHEVRFEFRSGSLRTGVAIAGATVALALAGALILRRRKPSLPE